MDYPLENLTPETFQQLCQALLAKELPGVQCFPVGQPDGGRDAIALPLRAASKDYVLFQIKFVRNPTENSGSVEWLSEIIKKEAPKVIRQILKGAKRYIVITNQPGSGHADSGTMDKASELLRKELGIEGTVWWRDDLNRRLDGAWDLKWVYPEILTGPDILRLVIEKGLSSDGERRTRVIQAYLTDQFARDEEVKFKQVELQNKLLDLFIDVPVDAQRYDIRHLRSAWFRRNQGIMRTGELETASGINESRYDFPEIRNDRDRQIGAAALLTTALFSGGRANQVVLEGAPGQGKSTITQFICQVHRIRLLQRTDLLAGLPAYFKTAPVRLPFKVDLRDFATWLAKQNPFTGENQPLPPDWAPTLENFLAAQVSFHAGGMSFSTDDLLAVFGRSSVLIALDGLDEVADIGRRREVVAEIEKGAGRIRSNAASLQVIVTSRPSAFANSPGFSAKHFLYLHLESLTRPLIDEYSEKWGAARRLSPREAADLKKVLREKLDQPHTRELARNTMQLAILLSLVHRRGASLPDKRTALYDSYVNLFFDRESEKSVIVRDNRDLLLEIHGFLAWTLHAEAEKKGHSSGSIAEERLRRILADYLIRRGHITTLADDLFKGIVERVVAIVSRVQGTYEFEVQPLREYFAARYLYETAPYSPTGNEQKGTLPERFNAIARNFYWFNVTRFFAGCYSRGELPSLIESLEILSRARGFAETSYPRVLAATLLSDWVFSQHPDAVSKVVELVLRDAGLRVLSSSPERRHGKANLLVLPEQCGRSKLIAHCLGLLEKNPPLDNATLLAAVLQTNVPPNELRLKWLDYLRSGSESTRQFWLDIGSQLGVAQTLGFDDIEPLARSDQGLMSLIRMGRDDLFREHEAWQAKALNFVLDGRVTIARHPRPKTLFQAFAQSFDPNRYLTVANFSSNISGAKVLQREFGEPFKLDPAVSLPTPPTAIGSFLAECDKQLERPCPDWNSSLEPWNSIVETGRACWGERLSLWVLANTAASIRIPSTTTLLNDFDLWDTSHPMCIRALSSRNRAGSPQWWLSQLQSAKSAHQRIAAVMLVLSWAGPATLTALADELDGIVKKLDQADWEFLSKSLSNIVMRARIRPSDRAVRFDLNALPRAISPRLALLFSKRANSPCSMEIFQKWLRNYDGRDPIILDYCVSMALPYRRDVPPSLRLAIIRRAYKAGIRIDSNDFYGGWYPAHLVAPASAARIAREHKKYPQLILEVADNLLIQNLQKEIVPVTQISDAEGWFPPNQN